MFYTITDTSLEINPESILDSLNNLADMLEDESAFEDEFYILISLITDIEYINNNRVLENRWY